MADRIKGITIEIDGQTTGLKKALGDITSQSISIQKELTDVNRLLKFDPGNAEALAQKQELLSKQIENTSNKLNQLKSAQSQVEEQFKSGNIGEEQYRAFQREIEFTEASLGKFKAAYQDAITPPTGDMSQPINDLNENLDESKGKLSEFGNTAKVAVVGGMVAVGAAIVGAGALAINLGNDYANASNILQTQTGATAEEMETLNQAMTNVYGNNFGESMQDVAESMVTVQTYLKGTGEDIQAATENAMGFKDAFGVEVPESMRSVQSLMKNFGITSQEAFNLLAQGQQQGLNYSDELYDSINEYSPQFAKFGLDAEDMFNIFNDGAIDGAFNLDKVGDAVKEFSIRAIDGSKTSIDGFTQLGFSADDMAAKFAAGGSGAKEAFTQVTEALANIDDPVKQSTIGVELFGTQWEDLGPKVVSQLGNIGDNFNKTVDTMGKINQVQYNTPLQALQGLGRQIETSVLLPIAQNVMPALNDMASKLQEAFSSSNVQSGISSLSDGISQMATGFADFIANVLPNLLTGLGWIMDNANTIATGIISIGTAMGVFQVVTLVQGLVTAFKAAQLATEGLTVAQWLYNAALTANPIGIIIAAVVGLVAAIVYLWNTNEGFRNAIIGAWEAIASTASTVWNGIVTFFTVTIPQAFQGFIDFVTNNWAQLLLLIVNPFAGAFALLYSNCDGFKTFIDGFIQSVITFFQTGWNSIVTFFTESVPAWLESMGTWFAELPNKIAFGLGEAIGSIIKWGIDTYAYLTTNVPIWINSIGTWFSELPGKIWTFLVDVVTKLGQWGSNIVSWISTNVSAWITSIVTFFSELPGKIWTFLVNVVTSIGTWGSNMLTEAKTGMTNVFNGIVDTFTNLPSKMIEIGGHIVDGLKNGIKDAWAGMTGWIGGLCQTFIDGVNKKMEVHSPSRVMYRIGGFVGEGFGLGIESTIGNISRQANAIADAAIPNVNSGNYDVGVNYNPIGGNNSNSTGNMLDAILIKMDRLEKALDIKLDGQSIVEKTYEPMSERLAFQMNRG